jgi:alkylhydroperoxidase/carboxymuconolactone decarboxylase family protein YurZ
VSSDTDTDAARVREAFVQDRGFWGPVWQAILDLDPDFLDAYRVMSGLVWRRESLDARTKELICVAVDATATHLYEPGIEQHIRQALEAGATAEEVMEVLELVCGVGLHGPVAGAAVLVDLARDEGAGQHYERESDGVAVERDPSALKDRVMADRGYWDPTWDALAALDPELLEAHLGPGSVAWRHGPLPPKTKHLVMLAADASTTQLHGPGIQVHCSGALRNGASVAEILDVLSIAGMVGIHAMTTAAPMLADEAQARAEARS